MPEEDGEVTGTKDKDVALGLGAFGVYSVARAFVNGERAANTT